MATQHSVVPHDEWLEARAAFLDAEKEFTRARDRLSEARRALPWEAVEKEYMFDGPDGRQSLAELFDGRSQLVVYHFMFGPADAAGCPHCSFWADNFNAIVPHLNQRDVTLVAVSRAPLSKLEAYKQRMGWTFKWVTSGSTSFNFDFQASFTPQELAAKRAYYNFHQQNPGHEDREGVSVFHRDASGRVFHTYSTYARGIDLLNTAYNFLDLVPKGRDEGGRNQYWVRRRDEYAK
jgi:predicted dithiol-disulfide oxidoreductase (DUF899 family)